MKPIVQTPLEQIRQEEQEKAQLRQTISALEESNATVTYELMLKSTELIETKSELAVMKGEQADLVYQLMQKGVL